MTLELISFVLAVLLGALTFALVKHTADEFDRWYEEPRPASPLRAPHRLLSLVAAFAAALLTFTR